MSDRRRRENKKAGSRRSAKAKSAATKMPRQPPSRIPTVVPNCADRSGLFALAGSPDFLSLREILVYSWFRVYCLPLSSQISLRATFPPRVNLCCREHNPTIRAAWFRTEHRHYFFSASGRTAPGSGTTVGRRFAAATLLPRASSNRASASRRRFPLSGRPGGNAGLVRGCDSALDVALLRTARWVPGSFASGSG